MIISIAHGNTRIYHIIIMACGAECLVVKALVCEYSSRSKRGTIGSYFAAIVGSPSEFPETLEQSHHGHKLM